MSKKGCCRECKYADCDADGCTCMIDGRSVYNASDYTCDQYRPAKLLTNADCIRQMTDEELAEMVSMKVCRIVKPDGKDCPKGFYFGKCDKCVIAWLKQEVSEDAAD